MLNCSYFNDDPFWDVFQYHNYYMNYNTSRPRLTLAEYGRNVQEMVDFALTIEDRVRRQKVAQEIIELMAMLNPQLKLQQDYKQKLWDHLFVISDFKLDVDSPYPIPTEGLKSMMPTFLPYPKNNIRYRHYGKNVETLIKKAIETDDPVKKAGLCSTLANFMKMAYKNWSNEEVSNDLIREDLRTLSRGLLTIGDEVAIESFYKPRENRPGSSQPYSQNQQRRGNNNNRFNKKKNKNNRFNRNG